MKHTSKILALVLVVMTVIMSLSAITASAATETVTKVLEASSLGANAAGTWTDGQEITAGTDDFFTLVMSAKAKTDGSKKTFPDEYYSETRISWGGESTSSKNLIKFTVPSAATAPALVVVGVMMMSSFKDIDWGDFEEAVPAFFAGIFMALCYSISYGIAAGFIFSIIVKICQKKIKEINPILWVCAGLFLLNFILLAII